MSKFGKDPGHSLLLTPAKKIKIFDLVLVIRSHDSCDAVEQNSFTKHPTEDRQ